MIRRGSDHRIRKSRIINDRIEWRDDISVVIKEICEYIYELNVKSVFECGCGSGIILQGIKTLLPEVFIAGCDRDQAEIRIGKNIDEKILQIDFAKNNIHNLDNFEFVFSYGVTGTLERRDLLKFVENMYAISNHYFYIAKDYLQNNFERIVYSDLDLKPREMIEKMNGYLFII